MSKTPQKQPVFGKAWAISDKTIPPTPPIGKDWIVLRLAMGIMCRNRCKKGVPQKYLDIIVPLFTMIATDRQAAINEVTAKLNELFNAFEEEGRIQAGIEKGRKNHERNRK